MRSFASRKVQENRPTVERPSAGGVVFRPSGRILLLQREDESRWCLPKGGVEEGESPEEAALREIREETGLVCTLAGHLTDIRYQFYWPPDRLNYDKTVRYFLAEVVGGGVKLERGFRGHRWCTEKMALALLYYENDKRVVREAFDRLREIRDA